MFIIERRITLVQQGLLPSGPETTARHCWNKLRDLYGHLDVHAQFALIEKVSALRLKDHNDCDCYLSEFSLARTQFAKMGVNYTELQAVHALIKGLPTHSSWISFTQITNMFVGEWVRSEARKEPDERESENAFWENLVSRLSQECLHLSTLSAKSQSVKRNGPGSEYAGYLSNIIIHKSKQNPNGVKCTNCKGISHDADHCFAVNGGMAGMREAFQNKTGPFAVPVKPVKKADATVIAALSSEISNPHVASLVEESNRPGDYSFTSIEEVLTPQEFTSAVNTDLSTLLDSGASSSIICDIKYFWTYDRQGAKSSTMANHGALSTLATGDCVAIIQYSNLSTRLTLCSCFHAPSAVINLLSVGKMVSARFRCNFEDNKVIISAPRPNRQTLCKGPMLNNLFFLDIEYLTSPKFQYPLHLNHVQSQTMRWLVLQKSQSTPIFGIHTWAILVKKRRYTFFEVQWVHLFRMELNFSNVNHASLANITTSLTPLQTLHLLSIYLSLFFVIFVVLFLCTHLTENYIS